MKIARLLGLNTEDEPIDVGLEWLVRAKNIDIDRRGLVSSRTGLTKVDNRNVIGMAEGLVLFDDQSLYAFDGAFTLLSSNVPGNYLTASSVDGKVYFSTGQHVGVVSEGVHRSAGLIDPSFSIEVTTGSLPSGIYLVAVSTIAADGRESGTSEARQIVLGDNSGISVSVNSLLANIYASGRDGKELYFVAESTALNITDLSQINGLPIDRRYMGPMPYAELIEEHRGRLFAAIGSYLYLSEPHDYETFDYNKGYDFKHPVTLLSSVEFGLYVGTDKELFYLFGETAEAMNVSSVHLQGVMRGTQAKQDLTHTSDASGEGVLFVNKLGDMCMGVRDGVIKNYTNRKTKVSTVQALTGVALKNKYVTATRGSYEL